MQSIEFPGREMLIVGDDAPAAKSLLHNAKSIMPESATGSSGHCLQAKMQSKGF
ncbi:MAG: hypothetical protein LBU32_12750 [Clostridiales bacterium]|jgi:hypothetical protein|nr:hypothetical protein [Clostridiales bacterium]